MTYSNVQFKNAGNDEGDVLNFFNNSLRNLVQKNSGDNTFSIVAEECHDKDAPVPLKTKSKIRLTHRGHTISQFEKGFINLQLILQLSFQSGYGNGDLKGTPSSHLQVIFVGFKDAVEIIGEAYFWVDGKLVDSYHQQEMVRESFAYNSIRPRDAKAGTPHAHSLWENVINMSPNVCGCYIPLELFDKSKKDLKIKMELVIPFTDQLALQAWRLYPNRILGEMEEEVKFVLDGLVWCQIPPKNVGEVKKFWDFNIAKEYNAPDVPITNHFTQIGNSAVIVHKVTAAGPVAPQTGHNNNIDFGLYTTFSSIPIKPEKLAVTTDISENQTPKEKKGTSDKEVQQANYVSYELWENKLLVEESQCEIKWCKSNCSGFGIKEDINNALFNLLNEPIIIPAQELTRHQFENKAGIDGFTSLSKSVPLCNATNITMMFPMHGNDFTVFQNIMYRDVRLVVNKKTYPETDFENTYDGRFVAYQLMANELDGNIEPTREFTESISRPLNHIGEGSIYYRADKDPAANTRYLMCPFDNTSFGINFQLERGNAGYVFDGLDSGSHAVTIEFRGRPINNTPPNDPYLYPDVTVEGAGAKFNQVKIKTPAQTPEPPHPEMWICSDTYWTWSIADGVKYYQRGIPAGYE